MGGRGGKVDDDELGRQLPQLGDEAVHVRPAERGRADRLRRAGHEEQPAAEVGGDHQLGHRERLAAQQFEDRALRAQLAEQQVLLRVLEVEVHEAGAGAAMGQGDGEIGGRERPSNTGDARTDRDDAHRALPRFLLARRGRTLAAEATNSRTARHSRNIGRPMTASSFGRYCGTS